VGYKGLKLDCSYRLDLMVHEEVVVELKCVERVLPVHEEQLLTYMLLTGKRVGLLIIWNFSVPLW
jgi:GxxExxY protein